MTQSSWNGWEVTWDRGAQVTVRSRPGGDVGYSFPAIVLGDTSDAVALFQPAGTVCKRRCGPRGGPTGRGLLTWGGSYEDVVFERSTIHLHVCGDPFWVIRAWNGIEYVGWYINLAAPWRRTAIGFDTVDQILDIVVADDLSGWRWKDEAELRWAIERGKLSAEEAGAVRKAGYEAITRMNSGTAPFIADWSGMVPDPRWPIPILPAGWDRADVSMP
jgi:hypothetical protein